jgi:hypothetical protein
VQKASFLWDLFPSNASRIGSIPAAVFRACGADFRDEMMFVVILPSGSVFFFHKKGDFFAKYKKQL